MAGGTCTSVDLCFGPFRLDLADARLIGPDGPIHIGRKAFDVLCHLVTEPGRLVTRDQLFDRIWNGAAVSESSLTSVIKELRRALGDDSRQPTYIEGVYGRGYRFIAAVSEAPRPALAAVSSTGELARDGRGRGPRARLRVLATAALVVALAAARVTGAVWLSGRDSGPPPMAYTGFRALEPGVDAPLAAQVDEAMLGGFSRDGQVTIRRAAAKPTRGYSLGGTISRGDGALKLSVRIENEATRAVLWSRVFEQPLGVADKVAPWLAARTVAVVRCGLDAVAVHGRPVGDEVQSLLFALCGAQFEENPGRALDIARQITVADPELAAGWSAVAWYGRWAMGAPPPPQLSDEQRSAMARALALDPLDARSRHLKVYLVRQGDLVAIDAAYRDALKARKSACCVYQDYSNFLRGVGRGGEARAMLERAQDGAPLETAPISGMILLDAAAGRTGEVRRQMELLAARELDPRRTASLTVSNALWTRDYAGALAALPQVEARMPPALAAAVRAGFEALARGDPAARLAASDGIAKATKACSCADAFTIRMQAALGDAEGALASMTAAADKRLTVMLSTIGWDPVLAEVRRLPAFPALVERAGLIRYWRETGTRPDFCAMRDAPPVCRAI